MEHHEKKLISIICESSLESEILETARKLGAGGYTILEARGGGSQGERAGDFEFNKNIKIEIICNPETADKICDTIRDYFFKDYALVIYQSDVEVMRSQKFA